MAELLVIHMAAGRVVFESDSLITSVIGIGDTTTKVDI